MSPILDTLPGLPMSVGEVTRMVRHMWEADAPDGGPPTSDFRASQMNLVLHFGVQTGMDEATRIFDTAIEFAQRYPCRIIVLCPREGPASNLDEPLEAKLFSQCYVGANLRELCCCEALMLSYPLETSELIDHAVSLWLETDLPVYHWFHRVPPERIDQYYHAFLARSQRVLFDSDVEGDRYARLRLPEGARLVDLARARALPIRQNLGQFLSNFRPASLIEGLTRVELGALPGFHGEAENLRSWMRQALEACARRSGTSADSVDFQVSTLAEDAAGALEVRWHYSDPSRFLHWEYSAETRTGRLSCDFGAGRFQHPFHIDQLTRSHALAEALFF